MSSKIETTRSTEISSEQINKLKIIINETDTIVIGAGSGLSTSAGLQYGGKRFESLFPEYIKKYSLTDMYSSAFYPFSTPEDLWGYWCKHIYHNRYFAEVNECYTSLLELVKNKNFFVITTNADHLFRISGFPKERLFYTQGDYGVFACSKACHNKTYDNKDEVMEMVNNLYDLKIPRALVPHCPICGESMTVNLRKDSYFVEDDGWHVAYDNYLKFISQAKHEKVLYLELGVGYNTPSIIKYPFWQMTHDNEKATYASINFEDINCPKEIRDKSLLFQDDIRKILSLYKD